MLWTEDLKMQLLPCYVPYARSLLRKVQTWTDDSFTKSGARLAQVTSRDMHPVESLHWMIDCVWIECKCFHAFKWPCLLFTHGTLFLEHALCILVMQTNQYMSTNCIVSALCMYVAGTSVPEANRFFVSCGRYSTVCKEIYDMSICIQHSDSSRWIF